MKTPKQFIFTLDDISAATGISVGNLRVMIHRKLFNPKDLRSIAQFIIGQDLLKIAKI